jgi:hypothetical protein
MSVKDKIAQVLALIEKHNTQVEDQADKVNVDEFQRKLKNFGGTTEEALSESKWEDLENCGLPRFLARKAAEIFRTAAAPDYSQLKPKTAEKMSVLYLLQEYEPSNPDSVAAKELKKRSYGKKFVAISPGGKVHAEASNKLFTETVFKHFPERDTYEVDGDDFRVYAIGEGSPETFDESPIFKGRALRPDGTDDQLNRSWDGVSAEVRQLIRLAIDEGELKITHDKAHNTLDIAIAPDAAKKLRQRYKKASVRYNELKEQGDLPKMKIARASAAQVTKQDPFYGSGTNKTF